ncbi:MAG: SPOR domain-containing protein, partial [Hymenobacteraceae bacterium]|nr:SPOR domain-containing protein [Hymenobacteraceae bacterium]
EESAPVEEVVETKEPVLTINGKTGRFYIITGGYSRLESAEASREAIRKQGQEAKVLLPLAGSKLYRVSAADFDTKEEALAQLNSYRKLFGETTWVLNN